MLTRCSQSSVCAALLFFFAKIHGRPLSSFLFFFNDPAPTEISPLSLHDALPILTSPEPFARAEQPQEQRLLHVQPVLGLIPYARAFPLERRLVNLFAAVGRQAMKHDGKIGRAHF